MPHDHELTDADRRVVREELAELWNTVGTRRFEPMFQWLLASAPENVRGAFADFSPTANKSAPFDSGANRKEDRVESHLAKTRPQSRKSRGAWFTPKPIVDYLIARGDAQLRQYCGLPKGWLTEPPTHFSPVIVWDPALGAGAFPCGLVRHAFRVWSDSDAVARGEWSRFVDGVALPRLTGCEIEPLSLAVACIRLMATLAATGYDFVEPFSLRWRLGDAFDEREPLAAEGTLLVVGNPPYGSLSRPTDGWIEGLIRGDQWPTEASYRHMNGQPVVERKSWLHDDYVKFLRLAQWQVEHARRGVVAMVTNHGFLDNAGFRGMRSALFNAFDQIEIVDLHGNANSKETSGDGSVRDENVFGISTGVAMSVLCRNASRASPFISVGDLRGAAADKLEQINLATQNEASLSNIPWIPEPPDLRFVASIRKAPPASYATGIRIVDLMPVSTTAPVTARDHFVVDFDRASLLERLETFVDLSIPDDEIRARWFQRTRSPRYASGDTRGWKLSDARRRLAADPNWRDSLRPVLYRPFDVRWIAWHEALIDWPRNAIVRHFLDRANIVFITRRQGLAGQPYNFFGVTFGLTLDGILRSDNKGSESLFPLWIYGEDGMPRTNVSLEVIADWERRLDLKFTPTGPSPKHAPGVFNTSALGGWIYAWFLSPTYRDEAIDALRGDFPRIPVPRDREAFFALSTIGHYAMHEMPYAIGTVPNDSDGEILVEQVSRPRFVDGRIVMGSRSPFELARTSEAVWNYRIGAHQPCFKFVADRRDRPWTAADQAAYTLLVWSINRMLQQAWRINLEITRRGGLSGCCADS